MADGRTRSRLSVGTAGQRAIGSLPPEILCCIVKLLHLSDKVAAERVSKVWLRELQRSQDPAFWGCVSVDFGQLVHGFYNASLSEIRSTSRWLADRAKGMLKLELCATNYDDDYHPDTDRILKRMAELHNRVLAGLVGYLPYEQPLDIILALYGSAAQLALFEDVPIVERLAHHVVSLDISNIKFYPPNLISSIASLSALTFLRLHEGKEVGGAAGNTAPLVGLQQLRKLDLLALNALEGVGQGHFAALQHLQQVRLSLGGPTALHPFSGAACLQLARLDDFHVLDLPSQLHLPGLTALVLQDLFAITGTPACFTMLVSLQVLQIANINCPFIGSHEFSRALGAISSLTRLHLDRVTDRSGQCCLDILQFQGLISLQVLHICLCGLSNGLEIPHSCSKLRHLNLSANALSSLPLIPASPNLVQVSLAMQQSNFQVDQSLSIFLEKAPSLRNLHLRQLPSHQWTLDSLMHLDRSTQLQRSGSGQHLLQLSYV